MKILSVNVALPQEVMINDRPVPTAIYKTPVEGPQLVGKLGIAGDGQADLSVHGGEFQAVYAYPHEHYAYWQDFLSEGPFSFGTFGENLTTSGLLETEVCIGDRFRAGNVLLEVTSPRLPCFKFGHKIGHPDILKPFLQSGRCGFYFRVVEEGTFAAGDALQRIARQDHGITMRTLLGLMKFGEGDRELLERASQIDCISPPVRRDLATRLAAA